MKKIYLLIALLCLIVSNVNAQFGGDYLPVASVPFSYDNTYSRPEKSTTLLQWLKEQGSGLYNNEGYIAIRTLIDYDKSTATPKATQDWIVSKINLYSADGSKGHIKESILTVYGPTDNMVIPVADLKYAYYDKHSINLKTFDNRKYVIEMNLDREDKLGERMIKAFVHLNKFYWRKIGKEAF